MMGAMTKRTRIALVVGPLVLVLVALLVLWRFGFFRTMPKTRIAQRTTYEGPSTRPVEDWPKWRGPRTDGITREPIGSFGEGGPKQLWAADVGLGYSSPIGHGGVVYLFTMHDKAEALTAFAADSGKIVWTRSAARGWTGQYAGTRATPAIDGGRIYTYGGAGDLTCRNLADGKQVWTLNVLKETGAGNIGWGMSSSPLVHNGSVIVQSGKGGPVALAADASSGKVVWKSQAAGKGSYAHPMVATVDRQEQLIVFAGDAIFGMDPATGRTLWEQPWKTEYDINGSTPVYHESHLFVSSAYGHGRGMFKLSAAGAQKLWEDGEIHSRFQGMILDVPNRRLYANSEGVLKCMSWPDGKILWTAREPKLGMGGSIVLGPDDLLLSLSDRGRLAVSKLTDGGPEVVSSADVVDWREAWATPLVYGRRVYVKGQQELICFELGGP